MVTPAVRRYRWQRCGGITTVLPGWLPLEALDGEVNSQSSRCRHGVTRAAVSGVFFAQTDYTRVRYGSNWPAMGRRREWDKWKTD
jgi:hypothetical protein